MKFTTEHTQVGDCSQKDHLDHRSQNHLPSVIESTPTLVHPLPSHHICKDAFFLNLDPPFWQCYNINLLDVKAHSLSKYLFKFCHLEVSFARSSTKKLEISMPTPTAMQSSSSPSVQASNPWGSDTAPHRTATQLALSSPTFEAKCKHQIEK